MLDQQDIKQIGEIVEQKVDSAFDRKQDKKVNFLIESLDTNEVLPDSGIKLLRQMEVFPSPTKLSA